MTMTSWKGRRCLVTGGAGFIGMHLVPKLQSLGAAVRVVDDLSRGRRENLDGVLDRIEFRKVDLTEPAGAREVCDGMDVVFHLASKVGGIGYYQSAPWKVARDNTRIDLNVLAGALDAGLKHYVYASSAHVYPGDRQTRPDAPPLREEDATPSNPEISYGWAKLYGEKMIEYACQENADFRAAIVRLVGAYGPGQEWDLKTGSAIPVFIRRAIEYPKRKPFTIMGTGAETRSYCFIEDVVAGLLRCAERLSELPRVGPINLGNEGRVTMGEIAQTVVRLSGKEIEIVKDTSRPTAIWGQAVDCAAARKVLGDWTPRVTLEEGIRRTYEYMKVRMSDGNHV